MSEATQSRPATRTGGLTGAKVGTFLARQGILIAFVLFMVGFTVANERFLEPDNILGVIRSDRKSVV